MTIAEIAARNRARRMEQIHRLKPLVNEAARKQDELREARTGVKDIRSGMEFMQQMKHVPNFFPTPKSLVLDMIERANIEHGMRVLEPSAGKGNIAEELRKIPEVDLVCIELNRGLADYLRKQGFEVECRDFLELNECEWDRIVMNPPFERGIDEKHIRHAFERLSPGGRLVAVACSTTGRKLEEWAAERGGYVEPLPEKTFATSERPTGVNTCLIVAEKGWNDNASN
jgi:phospholipid N-methyltransferase